MKIKSLSIFLLILSISFSGCDKPTEEKKGIYDTSEGKESKGSDKPQSTTQIQFEESEFDFGVIEQGKMVSHTFKFKNTGDAPLVISDARVTCGCTAPYWTKEPVLPGAEGKIDVKYNGSGSPGTSISKTVTVVANTDPAETPIVIKAKIRDSGSPMK